MATGWEVFGQALAGGNENAYDSGRLFTAQTEGALATAKQKQLEAMAADAKLKATDNLRRIGAERGIDPAVIEATIGGLGSDFHSAMQGAQVGQHMGFARTAADPNTSNPARQYALAAMSEKPFNPLEQVGPAGYTDITAEHPTYNSTPLAQAQIATEGAQAGKYNAEAEAALHPPVKPVAPGQAIETDAVGLKLMPGYMPNPAYDPSKPLSLDNPSQVPNPGGEKDPNAPLKLGMNALTQFARVINASANTTSDLKNIMSMPSGVSTVNFTPAATPAMSEGPATASGVTTP